MPSDSKRNSLRTVKTLPTPGGLSSHDAISSGSFKSPSLDHSETSGSYFPQISSRSSATRSPTPSLRLNTDDGFLLSPRSDRSIASSSYLTPPEFGEDPDAPPYKSRRNDSQSLNMLEKRTETISSNSKTQRSDKNALERQGTIPLYSREESWNSKVSSNLESHYCYTPSRTQLSREDLLKSLYSCPAPPVETRRWSSVEVGAKPFSNPRAIPKSLVNSTLSSISQESSSDEEFIETVRAKLTSRKVPMSPMETPATITLRKASGTSSFSPNESSSAPSPRSLGQTRHASNVWRSMDQRKPSAYLITSADIDSLTEMIDSNLKRSRSYQQVHCHASDVECHFQPQVAVHRPSVCNGFIKIQSGAPADVATTISNVHMESATPRDDVSDNSASRRRSREMSISKIFSANSVHEVEWERFSALPKLHTISSTMSTNGCPYERSQSMYEASTSSPCNPGRSWMTRVVAGGPKNEHLGPLPSPMVETCFEWSESKPQGSECDTPRMNSTYTDVETIPNVPVIVTCEDCGPETHDIQNALSSSKISKGKNVCKNTERSQNPFISAVTSQLDVISFPALPSRQKTSDWISPLPDMSAPLNTPESGDMKQMGHRRETLDDDSDTPDSPISPIADPGQWPKPPPFPSKSEEILASKRVESTNDHEEERPGSKKKHKTVVIQHPSPSVSRQDSWRSQMGGSIGVSSGRRRSSGHPLKAATSVKEKPSEPELIVSALSGSKKDLDVRRKSLSRHALEQRVQIMEDSLGDDSDRSCINHSWRKPRQDTGYVLDGTFQSEKGKGKTKRTATDQEASPMVIGTNSRGVLQRFPYSAPTLTLSSYASSLSSPNLNSPVRKPAKSSYITKSAGLSDRLYLNSQKSSASLQEDCVGIYITMTGTKKDGDGHGERDALCTPGCESHHCDSSGSKSGSVD